MQIKEGSKVTMHFSMHLEDGSVADSTKVNDLPGTVVMGDGTLTPGFEANIMGLKSADKKAFTVEPEDAFGERNPDNIYILPVAQFPVDMALQPGLIVEFEQPNGVMLPGVVKNITEAGVAVDFSHPLAGQSVKFDVEIIAVE